MVISENLDNLIRNIVSTPEFWKINYYIRSMKKAPHGGIFNIECPNEFLKYYPTQTSRYFALNEEIPEPLKNIGDQVHAMINDSNVNVEELLRYCLNTDSNYSDKKNSARLNIAVAGGIINSVECNGSAHRKAVCKAVKGEICYSGNFDINVERLILLFVCILIESFTYRIRNIKEIVNNEKFILNVDRYGLSDVTNAEFERQGFKFDNKYYLYNIFLDTSIGRGRGDTPKTIDIIKNVNPPLQILMRCDENLAVPYSQMVSKATRDLQKWRGINLNFDNITEQMKSGKETIVHYDPQTLHKILVYVKRDTNEHGEEFYHVNVEQLWNLDIFENKDDVIITNYIHGTYYTMQNMFEHIDFSVNQYCRKVFEDKYRDAEQMTGVSIGQYGDSHYKIWCVRGDNLIPAVWAELVCASLDEPFRNIFMETIGGTYTQN